MKYIFLVISLEVGLLILNLSLALYATDLYLYSAELKAFDGVGSFHKASKTLKSAGITEDFLLILGVRKSIAIDFLFQNL